VRHLVLRSAGSTVVAAVICCGSGAFTGPASAIAGGSAVPETAYRFTVKLAIGDTASCSGALVDPQWVLTGSGCFVQDGRPVTTGKPPVPTRAIIDRADLTSATGQAVDVVEVIKHPSRNVTLALLGRRIPDVPTIPLATSSPLAAEVLRITGFGRTADEWVVDRMRSALFTVTTVDDGSVSVLGAAPDNPATCKGDAGGPMFREGAAGPELVAVSDTSGQRGCLGETGTSSGTVGVGTTGVRADVTADWVRQTTTVPQLRGTGLPETTAVNGFTGFIRDPRDGAIYQVVNGARYHLNPDEYRDLGYPAAPDVAAAEINRHSAAVPTGSTFLRDYSNGAVYQVVNGARYHLNPTEYAALGSPAYVGVPPGFANRITGTVPSGTVFLRDYSNGAVYQVVNGARYHLNPTEFAALGSPAYVGVPPGFANRIGSVPAEDTHLRSRDTGNVFTIVSGRPHFTSAQEWSNLADPSFADVPQGFLDALFAR
jgi:hypothetical protein